MPVRKRAVITTSSNGKARFVTYCRQVVEEERKVFVRDKAGSLALTLDFQERGAPAPTPITISAQKFKGNFARCTSLAKTGLVFRLTMAGTGKVVYARAHADYVDPLKEEVETWMKTLRKEGAENAARPFIDRLEDLEEHLDRQISAVHQGMNRMAIGHHPQREGQIKIPDPVE